MLPTDAETVKIFQKTLRGFSGANTRIAFDQQILLPKNQRDHMKLIWKIKAAAGFMKTK